MLNLGHTLDQLKMMRMKLIIAVNHDVKSSKIKNLPGYICRNLKEKHFLTYKKNDIDLKKADKRGAVVVMDYTGKTSRQLNHTNKQKLHKLKTP